MAIFRNSLQALHGMANGGKPIHMRRVHVDYGYVDAGRVRENSNKPRHGGSERESVVSARAPSLPAPVAGVTDLSHLTEAIQNFATR